jgi:hypothetical protein
MMRMTIAFAAFAPLVLLAGCFNPDLGETPFRCAPTGKECPDGYRCNDKQICVREDMKEDAGPTEAHIPTDADLLPSKEGLVYLDGHPPQSSAGCKDEASEPNNTMDTATKIPGAGLIPGWEICYPGDVDHYAVTRKIGDKLAVKIKFFHKNGDLDAALLDPAGMVIGQSRSEDDNEQLGLSTVTKDGTYTIGVYGFGTATNTYDLELDL